MGGIRLRGGERSRAAAAMTKKNLEGFFLPAQREEARAREANFCHPDQDAETNPSGPGRITFPGCEKIMFHPTSCNIFLS